MRKRLWFLALLFCLSASLQAEPLTLNLTQEPRGILPNSDLTSAPCYTRFFCKQVISGFVEVYNDNLELVGTVQAWNTPSTPQLLLDVGQTANVTLGSFRFTGLALSALPLEYNFLLGIGGNGIFGLLRMTSSLFVNDNALIVVSRTNFFDGNTIAWSNGERFQIGGVTDTNGNLSVSITRVGPQAEVPEPATILLLGSGLAGVVAMRRKRRKLPTS